MIEDCPDVVLPDAEVRQVEESVLAEDGVDLTCGVALLGSGVVTRDAAAAVPDERREAYGAEVGASDGRLPGTVPFILF